MDISRLRVFHVRIERRSGTPIHAFDLLLDEVLLRVAKPYAKCDPIEIGGTIVPFETRDRVGVLGTLTTLDMMESAIRQTVELTVSYPQGDPGKWLRLEDSELALDVTSLVLKCGSDASQEVTGDAFVGEASMELGEKNRRVLVVHGRNEELRQGLFDFLRAKGLDPIEWTTAVAEVGTAPYVGEVLDHLFTAAQAVVVQMTPDEESRLVPELSDGSGLKPGRQPRPNVLFEAEMAMGRCRERTIIVVYGELRGFSDISGIHVVQMDGTPAKRNDLAGRLKAAGCPVDTRGTDWLHIEPMSVATVPKGRAPASQQEG